MFILETMYVLQLIIIIPFHNFTAGQPQPSKSAENGNGASSNMVDMSKSLASFHLSSGGQVSAQSVLRNKAMDESVDHLFKEGESVAPQEGSSKGAPELPDKTKTQMLSEFHRQKTGTIMEEPSIHKSEEDLPEFTKPSVVSTVSSSAPR